MTMTVELWVLVFAAILGLLMVTLPPVAAMSRKGYKEWNASSRDVPFDLGPAADRLKRAFSNFMETFSFFAVIVIALAFLHKSGTFSIWGAHIYLFARILYIPCYAFNLVGVRSFVWIVSLVGILMCLYTLFT